MYDLGIILHVSFEFIIRNILSHCNRSTQK